MKSYTRCQIGQRLQKCGPSTSKDIYTYSYTHTKPYFWRKDAYWYEIGVYSYHNRMSKLSMCRLSMSAILRLTNWAYENDHATVGTLFSFFFFKSPFLPKMVHKVLPAWLALFYSRL